MEPHLAYVADVASPERLRLHLSRTGVERSRFGAFDCLGWELVVTRVSPSGEESPFRDHWEETLLEILRYLEDYSDQPIEWRRLNSGEAADLHALQPELDASRRFQTAAETALAPDEGRRLCFNFYEDGRFRFTLEERICEGGLSAWVPRGWSAEYPHLAAAKEAARLTFEWVK